MLLDIAKNQIVYLILKGDQKLFPILHLVTKFILPVDNIKKYLNKSLFDFSIFLFHEIIVFK